VVQQVGFEDEVERAVRERQLRGVAALDATVRVLP